MEERIPVKQGENPKAAQPSKPKRVSPYAQFGTDKEAEKVGIVLDYGDYRIRVARAGGANAKFQELFRDRMRPHWRKQQNGTLSEELANDILIGCFVDAVVLGWEDVVDLAGNPIPFNRNNAIKLFTEVPELFRDVREQSADYHNFRLAEVNGALGN